MAYDVQSGTLSVLDTTSNTGNTAASPLGDTGTAGGTPYLGALTV
jgi:hypothetical protein